jgi:hypothetical protein
MLVCDKMLNIIYSVLFSLEFSGFFYNTELFPITRQLFITLNLPVPVTSAAAIAIQSRLPADILAVVPPVHFVNVQSQPSPSSSILPANFQQLLNAVSVLLGITSYPPMIEYLVKEIFSSLHIFLFHFKCT